MPAAFDLAQPDLLAELFHALSQPLTALHCAWEVATLQPPQLQEYGSICARSLEELERVEWMFAGMRQLWELDAICSPVKAAISDRSSAISLPAWLRHHVEDWQLVADLRDIQIVLWPDEDMRSMLWASIALEGAIPRLFITLLEISDHSSKITIDVESEEPMARLRIKSVVAQPFVELDLKVRLSLGIVQALVRSARGTFELKQDGRIMTVKVGLPDAP